MTYPPSLPPAPQPFGQPPAGPPPAAQPTPVQPVSAASIPTAADPRQSRGPGRRLPIALALVALVLGLTALAVSVSGRMIAATSDCAQTLWASYPSTTTLPSGWGYNNLTPMTGGGYWGSAHDASASSPPEVDFQVYCPGDTAKFMAAESSMHAATDKSAPQIGFAKVGDEVFATKSSTGYLTVFFRHGPYLVNVYTYSTDVTLDQVEAITKVIDDSLPK